MADVEVSYKGNKIVELSESGTKVLKTSGKYCEGDITVDYTKTGSENTYWDSIIAWLETTTSTAGVGNFIGSGNKNEILLIKLPYIKTSNIPWNTAIQKVGPAIEEIGVDLSAAVNITNDFLSNAPSLKKVVITGLKRESGHTTNGNISDFFRLAPDTLEEVYFDYFRPADYNQTNATNLFNSRRNLITIGGFDSTLRVVDNITFGKLDFSGLTSLLGVFSNCNALENVRFEVDSISANISLAQSSHLTKESVLSLINALDSTTAYTVSLHSDVKNSMDSWMCKLNESTGLYEDSDDSDAISYSSAVTDGKGWTLA